MGMETMVAAALGPLVGGRVFQDDLPGATPRPCISFRVTGGTPLSFLDGSAPAKEIVRVALTTWGSTNLESAAISKAAEAALRAATALQATVLTYRNPMIDSATGAAIIVQEFEFFV